MTHHAAMEYCRWLSKKTGKTYRLPTEAEWEYAGRAGTTTAYFFGDDPKKLGDYAWFAGQLARADHSDGTTHKVGKKKPNPWGLHDMYGNVAEWCLDQYKKDFYTDCSAGQADARAGADAGPNRWPNVVRGGSWADDPGRCRSAARRGSDKSWHQARSAAAAEHLVADQMRFRRLPRRACRRGAGQPEGHQVQGDAREQVTRADLLVPKLRLGDALPRSSASPARNLAAAREAELPGRAFPSRAWERGLFFCNFPEAGVPRMTTQRSTDESATRRDFLKTTAAGRDRRPAERPARASTPPAATSSRSA